MSRPVTRSMTRSQPVHTLTPPTPKALRTRNKLTNEEVITVKKYLVANAIYRQRHGLPISISDTAALRKGFEDAKRTRVFHGHHVSEQKWHDLCIQLIDTGMTSWRGLEKGIATALTLITYRNPITDLLSEGYIRSNIYKYLSIDDIQQLVGDIRRPELPDEIALDIMWQANDPTSQVHQDLRERIKTHNFEFCTWFIKRFRFNIDTNNGKDGGILFDALDTYYFILLQLQWWNKKAAEAFQFIETLLSLKPDMMITKMYASNSLHTPISMILFVLYQAHTVLESSTYVCQSLQKLLLHITSLYPLQTMYLSPSTGCYGYTTKMQDTPSLVPINNTWIVTHLSADTAVALLHKGGMDPNVTGDAYSTLEQSLAAYIEARAQKVDVLKIELDHKREELEEATTKRDGHTFAQRFTRSCTRMKKHVSHVSLSGDRGELTAMHKTYQCLQHLEQEIEELHAFIKTHSTLLYVERCNVDYLRSKYKQLFNNSQVP